MRKTLLAAAAVFLAVASVRAAEEERRTLTVTGTAEISVAPDICYMSFSVQTRHKSAADAYRQNNELMNKVNAAIKAAGIAAKDMQTTNFTISPEYHYEKGSNKRIFDGYLVSHTLNVKVRELTKVPDVLDAAVNAGANQVLGITFTVENPKRYASEARVDAIKAARVKASQIASLTDVKLGKPISISESEPGRRILYPQAAMMRNGGGFDEGVTLEPGEIKLTHTVYITYEIE
ncbi:26 kDa periplasmic immunogenic protein [subsurface metagenome]|nr:DUF541 domain-containing protein [bacterium]